ncbi:MAG: tRNA epoxyqueuosine(34) reductase QueG [Bacteroidales bacterium]|nr:tRNA epoxyqueuosine(34) reductase QueG [Bacteroidales bacterium]
MKSPEYDRHELTQRIKSMASELGFDACGIAEANRLDEDGQRLDEWLTDGFQAGMGYMERHKEKRTDPRLLVPGARSVIVLLMNYYPPIKLPAENNYEIARYAYGRDYHFVLKEKLHLIIKELQRVSNPGVGNPSRAFTDSAPVLERAWAERAGLGFIGKNTCLIHPRLGSFVFIAEIITRIELEYDTDKVNDMCGGCTRCIDACPTAAITAPRRLDARKCISFHTIESREEPPDELRENFGNLIFGCDICQQVCPWNRKAPPHHEPQFLPNKDLQEMTRERWESLDPERFEELFHESAIQRASYDGLMRNILFLKKNEGK